MPLTDSVEKISGVGPSVAAKLAQMKLFTVNNLIYNFPRRYEDYSQVSPVAKLRPGNDVTIKARISNISGRYVRRGMHITEALASDDTASIKVVWFNQAYRANSIKAGQDYYMSGKFDLIRNRMTLMNPAIELASDFPLNTARILPVYRETKGLNSRTLRKIMSQISGKMRLIKETLPPSVVADNNLMSHAEALKALHMPASIDELERAKERLGFEELFSVTLASLLNKQQFQVDSGVSVPFREAVAKEFTASLPFRLTDAQRKVTWQIYKDMQSTHPMNRLVEGDVGAGKTVVAAMAALMALEAGYQVAMMAPTELLARQHFASFQKLLGQTSHESKIGLLIGSMKPKEKSAMQDQIASKQITMVIGTHALIADAAQMQDLGLVIIDEQHRFGVAQRKMLQSKAGQMPHVLSMTATPIPRTLALTVYGELDVSVLDELPPGRTPVETKLVSPNSREPMYVHIESEMKAGRQVFVVCPLIEDSEALGVLSAETVFKNLSTNVFKDKKIGLLHGKLKADQKDSLMSEFVDGKLDMVVSTTVIEVGVDVPNATVMLIEAAERFGLAQLHQLRGRVGRGSHKAYCYLVMSDSKEPPRRLRALTTTNDGFKLAELDLELRGPGAIYGTIQSGQLDLRMANLSDTKLIARARAAAARFIESGEDLSKYKSLDADVARYRSVTNLN